MKKKKVINKKISENIFALYWGKIKNIFGNTIQMRIISVLFITVVLIAVFYLNVKVNESRKRSGDGTEYVQARVTQISSERKEWIEDEGAYRGEQNFTALLLSGKHSGKTVKVQNGITPLYNVIAEKDMTIILRVYGDAENLMADVYSYYRFPYYLIILAFFFGFMVLIAGKKGVKSAFGLIFTLGGILFILLPMCALGFSPLLAAIVTGVIVSLISLVLLNGFSRKTSAAFLGTAAGVCISGAVAYIVSRLAHVTIYSTDEADYILMFVRDTALKGHGMLFAGAIIAAMGAVLDVAVSIASAMWEMADSGAERSKLFTSGMNVGKDMIGTMANTLILAFAGSSINMILILYLNNISFIQQINSNFLGVEILQAVSGIIGVISAVPISAYISAAMLAGPKNV